MENPGSRNPMSRQAGRRCCVKLVRPTSTEERHAKGSFHILPVLAPKRIRAGNGSAPRVALLRDRWPQRAL